MLALRLDRLLRGFAWHPPYPKLPVHVAETAPGATPAKWVGSLVKIDGAVNEEQTKPDKQTRSVGAGGTTFRVEGPPIAIAKTTTR